MLGTTQRGLKPEVRKAKAGFLEMGRRASSSPARGLRQRCMLAPPVGSGASPGRNRYPLSSPVVSFENLVINNRSVLCAKFSPEIAGVFKRPKYPPLVMALLSAHYPSDFLMFKMGQTTQSLRLYSVAPLDIHRRK